MYICRNALLLQCFTSHQDASIILHHSSAIAIYIMKRQHNPYLHSTCGLGSSYLLGSFQVLTSSNCLSPLGVFFVRNKEGITLLQYISFLFHLWIGIHQFWQTQSILLGNTEDGILLLHRIDVAPFNALRQHDRTQHQAQNEQQIS